MAKPLGPKSILIREAITNNPDLGNTEIAQLINDSHDRMDDKITVKAADIAQQRQVMKKGGAETATVASQAAGKKGNGDRKPKEAAPEPPTPPPPAQAGPLDLIDRTLDLAQQVGGVAALKRLVDRLADMQR